MRLFFIKNLNVILLQNQIMNKKFSFSKNERLYHRKVINEVFANGNSFLLFPFRIQYLFVDKNEEYANAQILISIPKKRIKRAVDRNLIKRRTKESFRLNKHLFIDEINTKKSLAIAVVYIANDVLEYKKIDISFKKIITKLSDIIEKQEQNNNEKDS